MCFCVFVLGFWVEGARLYAVLDMVVGARGIEGIDLLNGRMFNCSIRSTFYKKMRG